MNYGKRVRGPYRSHSTLFGLTSKASPSPPDCSLPVHPSSRDPLCLPPPMTPGRCSPDVSSAAWHALAGSPHTCPHAGAQAQLTLHSSVSHSTSSSNSVASLSQLLRRVKCLHISTQAAEDKGPARPGSCPALPPAICVTPGEFLSCCGTQFPCL